MEGAAKHVSLSVLLSQAYEHILAPVHGLPARIWPTLRWMREAVALPAMKTAIVACLVMTVMVLTEKVFMGMASLYSKIFRRQPQRIYKCEPIGLDEERGSLAYPMVLVQIPMYNEKEVYQLSIGAACNLRWPGDRVIIQVLDDSTDTMIKEMVMAECGKWVNVGKNIKYETRANRKGYKAGALKAGMTQDYAIACEYVAMFDADFQPEPDFLIRTIPFLVHNPNIALVQARWKFVNADECLMTRLQEMAMDYHFKVEQEAGALICGFFGFNGTAGVWRIQAINDAGGWEDRTTVEDMDLSVRATLRGWKFVYAGDIKVKSELPSTFKAYRHQQRRWSCGPAVLFKKMFWEILLAKRVSLLKKVYLIYSFFFARKIAAHIVTFFFYSVVIPLSIFFPEVEIPKWGMLYMPSIVSILNTVGTPSSIHLVFFWLLFENVMALHRCKAVLIGLLEAGSAAEWIVTQKLGDKSKAKTNSNVSKRSGEKFWKRFHPLELLVGVFLIACACYEYKLGKSSFIFYSMQSTAFLIMGFGFIGTVIPSSK